MNSWDQLDPAVSSPVHGIFLSLLFILLPKPFKKSKKSSEIPPQKILFTFQVGFPGKPSRELNKNGIFLGWICHILTFPPWDFLLGHSWSFQNQFSRFSTFYSLVLKMLRWKSSSLQNVGGSSWNGIRGNSLDVQKSLGNSRENPTKLWWFLGNLRSNSKSKRKIITFAFGKNILNIWL